MSIDKIKYVLSHCLNSYWLNAACEQSEPIHREPTKKIYLDILEKNDFSYKCRLYLHNDKIVIGYIPHKFTNYVEFSNYDKAISELLDGRYNTVDVKNVELHQNTLNKIK